MTSERQTVDIELDGDKVTLTRTPDAVLAISDFSNGLAPAVDAISRLNVGVMAAVINAGAGLKGDAAKNTAKAICSGDLTDIASDLLRFMVIIAGGTPKGA